MTANELSQWAIAITTAGFAAGMWLVVMYILLKCVLLFFREDDNAEDDGEEDEK